MLYKNKSQRLLNYLVFKSFDYGAYLMNDERTKLDIYVFIMQQGSGWLNELGGPGGSIS